MIILCILQELPLAEAKIPRIGSPQSLSDSLDSSHCHPRTTTPQHAFHVVKKYKVRVHVGYTFHLRGRYKDSVI
jgi:hypothetical protein